MIDHSPDKVRTKRSAMLLFGVIACFGAAGVVQAQAPSIAGPAEASSTAERLFPEIPGRLFPIDPLPMCEVFNNFGGFSKVFGGNGHQGVDIGATHRQEIYAVESGVLYRQFSGAGSGHGWGLLGDSDTKYRYYHLDGYAAGLAIGDRVREGDLIGFVGDTGNASAGGYHLHFEIRPGPDPHKTPVDPVPLLAIPRTCNVY